LFKIKYTIILKYPQKTTRRFKIFALLFHANCFRLQRFEFLQTWEITVLSIFGILFLFQSITTYEKMSENFEPKTTPEGLFQLALIPSKI